MRIALDGGMAPKQEAVIPWTSGAPSRCFFVFESEIEPPYEESRNHRWRDLHRGDFVLAIDQAVRRFADDTPEPANERHWPEGVELAAVNLREAC